VISRAIQKVAVAISSAQIIVETAIRRRGRCRCGVKTLEIGDVGRKLGTGADERELGDQIADGILQGNDNVYTLAVCRKEACPCPKSLCSR
jgi:hypothetical protein